MKARRWLVLVLGLVALGPGVSAQADPSPLPEPVPGSCKLHATQVVNPGCLEALQEYSYTYPDLVPNVTVVRVQRHILGFEPESFEPTWSPPILSFDTYAQNLGTVAVDIQSDDVTNAVNPPASQCVAWKPVGVCRERRAVGGFEFHPSHAHIHFQDFAFYEVRRLDASGAPDYSPEGLMGTNDKVSFCLVDSTKVQATAFPVPTYNSCTGTREGITAGWADVYTIDLEGQQISLEGLQDGRYALIVSMNPAAHLYESSYGNNRLALTFDVTDMATDTPSVTVVGRHWS